MLSSLKKYLLVPKLVRLSSEAPKDPHTAWDQYWGNVNSTGAQGDVLWDAGDDHELLGYLEHLKRQMHPDLPIVDIGCGSGAFSRRLAAHFPHVLGVDVAPNAIARARTDSEGLEGISFLAADMTAPGAARSVAAALDAADMPGEANIFIRGVLHVLKPRPRRPWPSSCTLWWANAGASSWPRQISGETPSNMSAILVPPATAFRRPSRLRSAACPCPDASGRPARAGLPRGPMGCGGGRARRHRSPSADLR